MNQEILKGINNLDSRINGKKFLLVCDSSYQYLSIKNTIDKYSPVTFNKFTPNPLYEQVVDGLNVFNRNGCEMIVAIGGGSAIDVAKCIKLFSVLDESCSYLEQEFKKSDIPLIAIPTTAGTGSESTRHAVIYSNGIKQSISHESIVPDCAILEPSVLATLPLYQKKCTLLDALCQAIESWWSVNSTEESIEFSKKAILLIKNNWKNYIFENQSDSFSKILEAANYAGRAINITATTAAHAMSYKLSSLYGLPHGHAVAISMQQVWKYMNNNNKTCCVDPRGTQYVSGILDDIGDMFSLESFNSLMQELEMDNPISKDRDNDINTLVESVNSTRLKNNPIGLSSSVIRMMYEEIVK